MFANHKPKLRYTIYIYIYIDQTSTIPFRNLVLRIFQDEQLKTLQQLLAKHGLHDFAFGSNKVKPPLLVDWLAYLWDRSMRKWIWKCVIYLIILPYEPKCYQVKSIMDSGEWITFILSNPPNASNDPVDEDWNLRLVIGLSPSQVSLLRHLWLIQYETWNSHKF